ncbi:peptide methionine sulfoxide reductase protein [Echinococcus multilocularis]|uniref:Peptide methionine sulfoxide reductase protein n=1 Tax=Echinococcus multilocularis TaxID=6211 RepID=A0A0S4MIY2_ECHMU|nr:peptide methionine sulfoxide reductase protein [Echinococcus multilocularis]
MTIGTLVCLFSEFKADVANTLSWTVGYGNRLDCLPKGTALLRNCLHYVHHPPLMYRQRRTGMFVSDIAIDVEGPSTRAVCDVKGSIGHVEDDEGQVTCRQLQRSKASRLFIIRAC